MLPAFSALPTSMWVVFRKEPGRRCGYVHGWTGRYLAPAISALPPSVVVGRKLLHAFSALPPSVVVGRKLLHAFSALPTSMWVVFCKEPGGRCGCLVTLLTKNISKKERATGVPVLFMLEVQHLECVRDDRLHRCARGFIQDRPQKWRFPQKDTESIAKSE